MLFLKGDRGKSVVCDAIIRGNRNVICCQYVQEVVPTLNSYIVSLDNSQELLGEKLFHEVEISNPVMLVIYTNEKQENLIVLQKWINKIESSFGGIVVLTCK